MLAINFCNNILKYTSYVADILSNKIIAGPESCIQMALKLRNVHKVYKISKIEVKSNGFLRTSYKSCGASYSFLHC